MLRFEDGSNPPSLISSGINIFAPVDEDNPEWVHKPDRETCPLENCTAHVRPSYPVTRVDHADTEHTRINGEPRSSGPCGVVTVRLNTPPHDSILSPSRKITASIEPD